MLNNITEKKSLKKGKKTQGNPSESSKLATHEILDSSSIKKLNSQPIQCWNWKKFSLKNLPK